MGWETGGRIKREGHIYTHGWVMLMYGRNQDDIVRQLSYKMCVCVCVCVCGVCIQYTQMLTHIPWRREKLPTPGFRPGEFQGLCGAWDRKESDTTERLWLTHSHTTHILHWYNKPHSSVIQIHVFSWFQLSQLCHQALTNSNKHGYFFFNWS